MAFATVGYGFCGLLLCFRLAREFVAERWAFLSRHGILVRQLTSGLHVFESVVVARAHTFFRIAFSLLLASNPRAPRPASMDRAGIVRRADGERLLSERNMASDSGIRGGIELFSNICGDVCATQRRRCARIYRIVCSDSHVTFVIVFSRGNVAYPRHPENYLRRIFRDRLIPAPMNGSGRIRCPRASGSQSDHGLFTWTPILALAVVGLVLFLRCDRTLALLFSRGLCAFFVRARLLRELGRHLFIWKPFFSFQSAPPSSSGLQSCWIAQLADGPAKERHG